MRNARHFLTIITLVSCICSLSSCKKNEETDPVGVNIDTAISISVLSEDGDDLLNPLSEGHIDTDKIRIAHLINGEVQEFHNADLDFPYGYDVEGNIEGSNFRLATWVYQGEAPEEGWENKIHTMYIKWTNTDTDTLKCQMVGRSSYLSITKVWCNDLLVWDQETDSDSRMFEIMKKAE